MNYFEFILVVELLFLHNFQTECAKLVWKNHISIDSDNFNSDLEQISSDMLASLNLLVDDSKFERLHNLVNSQPKSKEDYHNVQIEDYDYETDYEEITNQNKSRKRLVQEKLDYPSTINSFVNGSFTEFDYNLEQFKQEYDSVTLEELDIPTVPSPVNMSVITSNDDRPFQLSTVNEYSNNCMSMPSWKYLIYGYACIWHELWNIMTPAAKFSNILIISVKMSAYWVVIYAMVATIFWFYNGTCCCCIKLDILHPYEGMKKIKMKAQELPPGTIKLPNGKIDHHNPSESEMKAYKSLLKSIYT